MDAYEIEKREDAMRDYLDPGNDLARAYEASRRELGPLRNDSAKIEAARRAGLWVAERWVEHFCPRTDVCIGCERILIGAFITAAEAYDAIGGPRTDSPDLAVVCPVEPDPEKAKAHEAKTNALHVLLLDKRIRAWLDENDPQAVKQAVAALGEDPAEAPPF